MSDAKLPAMTGKVETNVDLKPQGSQTFLVGLIVLAGVSLIVAALMLAASITAGWAFFGVTVVIAGVAARGWFVAHADSDLTDAKPTTVSSTPQGITVSTDSRTLRDATAAQAISTLIEVSQRQRLPEADAVFENGHPLPNSAAAANAIVQQINNAVEEQAAKIEALLHRGTTGPEIVQTPDMVLEHGELPSVLNLPS